MGPMQGWSSPGPTLAIASAIGQERKLTWLDGEAMSPSVASCGVRAGHAAGTVQRFAGACQCCTVLGAQTVHHGGQDVARQVLETKHAVLPCFRCHIVAARDACAGLFAPVCPVCAVVFECRMWHGRGCLWKCLVDLVLLLIYDSTILKLDSIAFSATKAQLMRLESWVHNQN